MLECPRCKKRVTSDVVKLEGAFILQFEGRLPEPVEQTQPVWCFITFTCPNCGEKVLGEEIDMDDVSESFSVGQDAVDALQQKLLEKFSSGKNCRIIG